MTRRPSVFSLIPVVLTVALAAVAFVFPTPSARALDVEGFAVKHDEPVTKEYPPIPTMDPATPQLGPPDPGTCSALPSCNSIRIEFLRPPGFTEDDVYIAQLDLKWPHEEGPSYGGIETGTNDLDVYVWAEEATKTAEGEPCFDDTETEEDERPEYCTNDVVKSDSTGGADERVRFDAVSHPVYLLLINNNNGVNLGYTLQLTPTYAPFSVPDDPVPDIPVPDINTGDAGGAPSRSTSSPSSGAGGDVFPGLTPISAEPVSGLTPVFPGSALVDLEGGGLSATLNGKPFLRQPASATGPAEPASGLAVALGLMVLPVLTGAAGGYWFLRHRPAALRR